MEVVLFDQINNDDYKIGVDYQQVVVLCIDEYDMSKEQTGTNAT